MGLQAGIGTSDFVKLRQAGRVYVDKTASVAALLREPAEVVLLPRPRRFGKTLFLSTIRAFVERDTGADRAALFADLAVWQDPEARQHFQRYPVLFLTFKDLKPRTWPDCQAGLAALLSRAAQELSWLADHPAVTEEDAAWLAAVVSREADPGLASEFLRFASGLLHRVTGEPVFILIDEYDSPLHAAWLNGYWDEAVSTFRALLGAGLKDNPHLYRGVLTGILRVARESIFSGLNNLITYSLLYPRYSDTFGFTEVEVEALAAQAGALDQLPGIQLWYNGYRFGDQTIYNPWSVLNYLTTPAAGFQPYWVNTSSNDLIERLLIGGERDLSLDLERLMQGETLRKVIDEALVLRDLDTQPEALWSLLLMSGYLKVVSTQRDLHLTVELAVPNREMASLYYGIFRRWLTRASGASPAAEQLIKALLAGDQEEVEAGLSELLLRVLSYHDVAGASEKVYHAFVLGLLAWMGPEYRVVSDRESGFGRADTLVIPTQPGRPGLVLELKRVPRGRSGEAALKAALEQASRKDYAAELRAAGADPVRVWAFAFSGKEVAVRLGA